MTLGENVAKAKGIITDSITAAKAKGATFPPGATPEYLPTAIEAIPSGGGSGDGWQPPSDWWDIKTMVDTGVLEWNGQTVENVRYGFIVSDGEHTTRLPTQPGFEFYLSDGSYYNSSVTHTWDRNKDKPCSEGYKTRAVIVANSTTRDVNITHKAFSVNGVLSLYIYLGDCNIKSLSAGDTSQASANTSLVAIDRNALATWGSLVTTTFSYCVGLRHIALPDGASINTSYMFRHCYGLESLTLPDSVINVGTSALAYLQGLKAITIKGTLISNFLLYNSMGLRVINVPVGFESPIDISTSPSVSVSSLEQLVTNAADMTGEDPITFTIGATNIAKLSPEYLQLAANKNITLA